jgi:hypothetical protein
MRPKSIIWFERFFLGAWLLGLLNTVLNWDTMMRTALKQPGVAEVGPALQVMLMVSAAVGLLIPLLLWFFIARKGSVVAKWILVVLYAIGVLSFLFNLVSGNLAIRPLTALPALIALLQLAAVFMLFQPDTKPWFGEDATADPDEDVAL